MLSEVVNELNGLLLMYITAGVSGAFTAVDIVLDVQILTGEDVDNRVLGVSNKLNLYNIYSRYNASPLSFSLNHKCLNCKIFINKILLYF